MRLNKQILFAFLIPFSLAVALALLADYFFPKGYCLTTEIRGEEVCFSYYDYPQISFAESIYMFLTLSLFLASLIVPSFITGRAYQSKLSEISTKSIFK